MVKKTDTHHAGKEERRVLAGSWPWFVLNIIVFPGPAHLTLLRARDFSSKKNMRHMGMTILLFFVLFVAALLQLTVPAVGRLWLFVPLLSGFVILYFNHSLKSNFKPVDLSAIIRDKKTFLIGVILLFTIISVLPSLNLIELNQKPVEAFTSWIGKLPFWQDLLILLMSLLLLFVGYLMSAPVVSINRTFILYACFFMIELQIFMVLIFTYSWLKIRGGFWLQLTLSLLAAILALDYWDARSFGQYMRRFFFLTCTKGFSLVFLILCFYGLPQKTASVLSGYYYNKVRPASIELSPRHLIFTDRDRFESAHTAGFRIRSLYARSFIDQSPEDLNAITDIVNKSKGNLIPNDTDICLLAEHFAENTQHLAGIDLSKVPMFRPIHPDWDVMLTALLRQGLISGENLDKYIAGFKKMLPKTSKGELPDLDTPYDARYIALATGIQVDYIEPRFEDMVHLLENSFNPVLTLSLSGKDYLAALLSINMESGLAWFRIQSVSETHKAIQLLFDANESKPLRNEIFSRLLVPVSIDYLRSTLLYNSAPIIIFSKNGLAQAMPERFDRKDLEEINKAIAVSSIPGKKMVTHPADFNIGGSGKYADYMIAVTQAKLMLRPTPYRNDSIVMPVATSSGPSGIGRLHQISALLENHIPLRENDRMEIAYLLVRYNHVYGFPELFIKLALAKPLLNDIVDCCEAFMVGRQLFLSGYHKEAFNYLHLAFLRHPFNSEYELWYQITRAKLKMPQVSFYSPPDLKPDLALYYRTVTDMNNGKVESCRRRLIKFLEKDSHNSLANHLLSKYFGNPLDDRYFFTEQEGL